MLKYIQLGILVISIGYRTLSAFEGFYFGGSAGGGDLIGKQNGTATATAQFSAGPSVATTPLDLKGDSLFSNFISTIYAGYGLKWHYFYNGIELSVQYIDDCDTFIEKQLVVFPGDLAIFDFNNQSKICVNHWNYAIDYRPGFILSPQTLLYGRFGLALENIKLSTSNTNEGIVPPETWTDYVSKSEKSFRPCLHLGCGIEQKIYSKLALRLDYTYTDYGYIKIKTRFEGQTEPGGFPTSITTSKDFHLNNHALQVGLSYYLCSNPCSTSLSCPEWNQFCGIYVGGGGGGKITDTKITGNVVGKSLMPPQILLPVEDFSPHTSEINGLGTVYAGYGFQWKRLYTGVEIFSQYAPFTKNRTDQTTYIIPGVTDYFNRIKTKKEINPWQFGVEARPGFALTPFTLIYGKIGTSVATIKGNSDVLYSISSPFVMDGSIPLNLSRKSTRAVLRGGGGIEYLITSCLSLRAEYIYTHYGKMHLKGFNQVHTTTGNILNLSHDTTIKFSSHAATLGIVCHL